MKCPYCQEEIQETALACRHCGRDFLFYKPFLERISTLERKISEIDTTLKELASQSGLQPGIKRLGWGFFALVVFFAAAVPAVCNHLNRILFWAVYASYEDLPEGTPAWVMALYYTNDIPEGSTAWIPLNLIVAVLTAAFYLVPLLFGYWTARRWAGQHILGYTFLGLAVGAVAFPLQIAPSFPLWYWDPDWFPIDWQWSFALFFVTPAAMFVTGGIVGDLAEMNIRWTSLFATPLKTAGSILRNKEAMLKIAGALATALLGAAAPLLLEFMFGG